MVKNVVIVWDLCHSFSVLSFLLSLSLFCVLCTQCCLCLWIVHSLLPPSVFSNIYSSCVLCTQCCLCLWIVHSLLLPSVFSNIYSSCVLCTQCCLCLWIVHSWFLLRFSLTFIYQFLWLATEIVFWRFFWPLDFLV